MIQPRSSKLSVTLVAIALLAFAAPAWCHETPHVAGGFAAGLQHPLLGWDHVVAMVAVGSWGACLGAPAVRILPILFPLAMAVGAALSVASVALPGVETGIAASAIVLGLAVLAAIRAPVPVAALVVAVFALFHGHAHGTELPDTADFWGYGMGLRAS